MLTSNQLDAFTQPIIDLFEEYAQTVINDIARRLAGLHFASAAWQVQRLSESGKLYESILAELETITGLSEAELRKIFRKAGVKAMAFDDAIYKKAGLDPLPLNLSPAMAQTLAAGLAKTQGVMRNLTMTTALTGQEAFISAADLAYMQITTGAFDYNTAIRQAVKQVAADGVSVINYANGRRDQLDVAMRRTVLTGMNQTAGELQMRRADEMGQDLVQTSAHIGARNKGSGPMNHESWQGRIFSRSSKPGKYPDFVAETGYGTGPGLCGWNCVVGDTIVSGPTAQAAYRREYSGEIVTIRTARNKELSITPNHPILTTHGWVSAGLLRKGDDIVCRRSSDGTEGAGPNDDKRPTSIKDVFCALGKSGKRIMVSGSSKDFHGDGSNRKIDIVFSNGLLRNSGCTPTAKQFIKSGLSLAPDFPGSLVPEGALAQIFFCTFHAAHGIVGWASERLSLFRRHSSNALEHSLRSVLGKRDAKFRKVLSNSPFGNACFDGNLILPHPVVIHREQIAGRNPIASQDIRSPISASINSIPLQAVDDGLEGTAVFFGNGGGCGPDAVEIDNIVFVERKSTQGSFIHVYNLETEGGWYYANGIITHNCRHSFFPFFAGISQNAYDQATLDDYAGRMVSYNGKEMSLYDATQTQRSIERKIRYWKRQAGALKAADLDAAVETAKVSEWQARMRSFIKQTGLDRQYVREQVS